MRLAVYTCVTGGYDPIRPPLLWDVSTSYFCFTEREDDVPAPWHKVLVQPRDLGPKDSQRFVKMFPHLLPELAEFDVTVYVDGSIQIIGDIRAFIAEYLQGATAGVWMFDHPKRDCIYEEGWACAYYSHEWIWKIVAQLRRYWALGFPRHYGLTEAGLIVRFSNDPMMPYLMSCWWDEYILGAKRDQLALSFCSWCTDIPVQSLGRSDVRFDNRYFRFHRHKRRISLVANLRKFVNRLSLFLLGNWLPLRRPEAL